MKNKANTSFLRYLSYHIFPALWCCFVYYVFLFIHIPELSVNKSKIIFFVGNQAIWFVLAILTPKKRRNKFSALIDVFLAYTPYFLITYAPVYKKIIGVFAGVIIALSVLYFAVVVFKKIKNKANTKKVIKRRVKFAFRGIKNIAGVLCLVLICTFVVCTCFGIRLFQTEAPLLESANADKDGQWTVKNNIDIVKLLRPDDWKKLSVEEKLGVLGVVRNIELRYLGMSHEIYLATAPTPQKVLGYYDDKEHTIVISYKLLESDDAEQALATLCHEMHHAYAYNQIEVYKTIDEKYKNLRIFSGAKIYEEEFENYISANEDTLGYLLQDSEIDAEIYARNAVKDYYRLIEQYLKENEKTNKATNNI